MTGQVARLDALGKVTGRACYAADVVRPDVLCVKVLRSPHAHARLIQIRTDSARALDGVRAVLTGADIPAEVRIGRAVRDMPVLARDKVRFIGEKVVAVAADTPEIAERALRLVDIEYAPMAAVFEPLEAMQPDAPRIHEAETVRAWAAPRQVVADYPNSVSLPTWGRPLDEVERAIASAPHIAEHTFHTPNQHQGYIEPHAATVAIDGDGLVHIWASNKAPFLLMDYLRAGLGLTRDQIRVHILPLGGDFGGKGSAMDIPLLYFLARHSGRPVKMVMSYVEELTAGNPRHAASIVVRSGVGTDGRIVGQLMRVYFNSGAYAAFKPSPDATLPSIPFGGFGAYDIAASRLEAHMIYTNSVPGGHMRGPGEAQTAYALECHMELTARELGFDPVQFRRLNATTKQRTLLDGSPGPAARAVEVLAAAAEAIGWGTPRGANVGRGLALLEYSTMPGIYSANLGLTPDGQLTIYTAIVENGVGSHTAFREIVAHAFGIPIQNVQLVATTDRIGYDRGVGGARITRLLGTILETLAARIQDRLRNDVAAEFGFGGADVEIANGGFRLPDGSFVSLAEAAVIAGESMIVESLTYEATPRDNAVVYLCEAAEVEIDPDTGQVIPRRLVSAHEVGRIIRRDLHDGQIKGGVAQGLGYALMEGLELEEGRVLNLNLHEYKMPTQADMPPLDIVLLPPDPVLGITPIGEGPSVGVAPAIANAVVDVVGPMAFDLPLRPEVVLAALRHHADRNSTGLGDLE